MNRYFCVAPAVVLFVGLALPLETAAQNCRKGKPCGDTCIARAKVCRVGPGTAHWAPDADTGNVSPPASPRAITGPTTACMLARVVDGDTIECTDGGRVRLLLIDAPEMDQGQFGRIAADFLRGLIPTNSALTLETDVVLRDKYDRLLAYAWFGDGRLVNEEMAHGGMALAVSYPPNVRHIERIRAAVTAAQAARRGLWATAAFACAPADHRAGKC